MFCLGMMYVLNRCVTADLFGIFSTWYYIHDNRFYCDKFYSISTCKHKYFWEINWSLLYIPYKNMFELRNTSWRGPHISIAGGQGSWHCQEGFCFASYFKIYDRESFDCLYSYRADVDRKERQGKKDQS